MRVELYGCTQEGPTTPEFCFFVLQEDNTYKWKCEERGQCFHVVRIYIQQVLVAPLVLNCTPFKILVLS